MTTDGLSSAAAAEPAPSETAEELPDTRQQGRTIIDTFGKGWSKPDIDLLMSIFAPDAVFVETPFSESIRGSDAIRRWWLDVPFSQSEITFSSGEIYAAGPWFSTEFKCVFRRKRTGEWVDARGAIFCEMDRGLVTEMRMYWHRWNGGRETGKP